METYQLKYWIIWMLFLETTFSLWGKEYPYLWKNWLWKLRFAVILADFYFLFTPYNAAGIGGYIVVQMIYREGLMIQQHKEREYKKNLPLLFAHKLDTCCQAMCQEHKMAKNPAFRRRRIINRLDSVTVCTIGVNSKNLLVIEFATIMVLTGIGIFYGNYAIYILGAFYGWILFQNLKIVWKSYFEGKTNVLYVALSLTFLALCDTSIFLNFIWNKELISNLIWCFYVPSQLLLAKYE